MGSGSVGFGDRAVHLRSRIWAVVPVKELNKAKSRLSPLLKQNERRNLVLAMLDDVLRALKNVKALSRILVVSRDPDAAAAAANHGADALAEPPDFGQNGALSFAADIAKREGAGTILIIPADVPLLDVGEVVDLLNLHRASPAVTIVPDRHALGTNAMVCSPPDVLSFHFGDKSFLAHIKIAEESGIRPTVLNFSSLALDIDKPEDISLLKHSTANLRTVQYLNALMLAPVAPK